MAASSPTHSVAVVGIVVSNDGRVLAIRRRDSGAWQPPGGVLELDESIHAGLVREVEEETGVQVEPIVLSGVYKNMAHGIVAVCSAAVCWKASQSRPTKLRRSVGSRPPRAPN